jgi:hypothetical protein
MKSSDLTVETATLLPLPGLKHEKRSVKLKPKLRLSTSEIGPEARNSVGPTRSAFSLLSNITTPSF